MLDVNLLKTKTILVTGSSRGIGKEITGAFLDQGCKVIGISNKKKIVDKDINLKNYTHYVCDLNEQNQLYNCLLKIKKKFKKVDVIINNAGITINLKKNLKKNIYNFKKTLNVNLVSMFTISYFFADIMKKNKIKGNIINISSIGAILGFSNNPAYTSSKSGILALTKSLAVDYGKYNINSCNI